MWTVQFEQCDATYLVFTPHVPFEIKDFLRGYCLCNRDSPPPYEIIYGFLNRTICAGILEPSDHGKFAMTQAWTERMEQLSTQCIDEFDRIEILEEQLRSQTWPALPNPPAFVFSREAYEAVAADRWA